MQRLRILIFLIGIAWTGVVACAPAGTAPVTHPPDLSRGQQKLVSEYQTVRKTLSNGLELLILPDDRTNLVRVDMRYRVGAVEDPPGKDGLAHMTEHLLFELDRPGLVDGPTLAARMADTALYQNGYTSWDDTQLSAVMLREELSDWLALEKERMSADCSLQLDEETLARERQVVLNEIRERSDQRVADLIRREVYGLAHPYRRSISGRKATLEKISLGDVCEFFDTHYGPGRAVLTISGNVSSDVVVDEVARLFGPLSKPVGDRAPVPVPQLRGTRSAFFSRVPEPTVVIAFPGVPGISKKATVMEHLRRLLAAQLNIWAEEDDAVITSASVERIGGKRAPVIAVRLTAEEYNDLPGAVTGLFEQLESLEEDLNADRVPDMRNLDRMWLLFSVESFLQRGPIFTDHLLYGTHEDFVVDQAYWIDDTSAARMAGTLSEHLRRSKSHILYIRPDKNARESEQRSSPRFARTEYDVHDHRLLVDRAEARRDLQLSEPPALNIQRRRLDNGLEVILVPDLSQPVVDVRLVIPAGALNDPPDKPGLAELALRMLEPRLPRYGSRNEIRGYLEIVFTDRDFDRGIGERSTTFRIRGLSQDLHKHLWWLHWLLENGYYDPDALDRVRETVRADEKAGDLVEEPWQRAMAQALFGADHPYARGDAVILQTLDEVSHDDLARFRQQHYRLDGAALIITGQFDDTATMEHIESWFSWTQPEQSLKRSQITTYPPTTRRERKAPEPRKPARPPRSPVPAVKQHGGVTHLASFDRDAVQVEISMAHVTGGFARQRAARRVLHEIIRARMADIRRTLGVTYGVDVTYIPGEGAGRLLIRAKVDRRRAGKGLAAMRAVMADLAERDITEDFIRARRAVVGRVLARSADSASVATELAIAKTYELPADHRMQLAREIAALRPEAIEALIDGELAHNNRVLLLRGPRSAVEQAYRAAGITDYRVAD